MVIITAFGKRALEGKQIMDYVSNEIWLLKSSSAFGVAHLRTQFLLQNVGKFFDFSNLFLSPLFCLSSRGCRLGRRSGVWSD